MYSLLLKSETLIDFSQQFHPASNIEKMSQGISLTDQDRWDWLITLRRAAMSKLSSPSCPSGVVVTCSALKQKYRDVIRIAHYNSPDILVHFVYLHATEEVLLQRVGARKGHYMGANMVHSQLESLEEPTPEETDVISVDVSGTKDEVEAEALRRVREVVKTEMVRDS
jgi:gluconokinase